MTKHRWSIISLILGLSITFSYAVVPQQAQAATANPTLSSIPPNTALLLGQYTPADLANCFTPSGRIISQSRFTYDSVNNQMLMFGGGHASTPRTDVDVLNLNAGGTLQWQSAYPPTPVSEMTVANFDRVNGSWLTTGHPTARHTYDEMPFAPNTGELILLAMVNPNPNCQEQWPDYQKYPGKIWHYNPNTKQWTPSPASLPTMWGVAGGMPATEYDPVSGKIIIIGKSYFATYDPIAKVLVQHPGVIPKGIISDQNMVYFPPNDKMYYIQNNGTVFEVTLDRNNFNNSTFVQMMGITGQPPNGVMPPEPGATGETGFAYDSVNRVIGGAVGNDGTPGGNGAFYAFDPLTKNWAVSVIQTATSLKPLKQSFHAIDYDTVDNVFIFITSNPGGTRPFYTWAYKYGGSGGTTPPPPAPSPDTQVPSVPSGLTANPVSQTQINLSWNSSTDNVSVTGYKIYRGEVQVGTTGSTSFSNTGLSAGTSYTYTVAAYDATGNNSAQSNSVSETTQSGSAPPPPPPPPSPGGSGVATGNGITITEQDGVSTDNYPIQVGRPFVQGEILNYPVAIIGGSAVGTQADVKQRWPDGSVRHAIINFLIPTLSAYQTVSVTFANQAVGNNTPLSKEQMLGNNFNFDATVQLSNGVSGTASARQMLTDGSYANWLSGPIATSIILADHSTTRKYDLGSDSNRAFRPIFEATFWPGINKVHIRFIGEVSNSEAFEDQSYALTLKTGLSNPLTVYNKGTFTHYAGSRWTKNFWIGGSPSRISINHNLSYLTKTYLLPNYDTSRVVPQSELTKRYTSWQSASKDLFDAGNWEKYMGGVGGRPEIGPYPTWTVHWLYSGDIRMKEMAFGNADLAAAWPMHVRESNSNKFLDRAKTVPGLGKVISISTRPTLKQGEPSFSSTKIDDKIKVVGAVTNGGWLPDGAHVPDPFSPQYLLSGEYWYLEESLFWAGYGAAQSSGAAITRFNGRGPTGAEGALTGIQPRAVGWLLRNRINAASIAPDSFPEKQYFNTLIDDAIAGAEGEHGITNTSFYNTSVWKWANTYARIGTYLRPPAQLTRDIGLPPLHFWNLADNLDPNNTNGTDPTDPTVSQYGTEPWGEGFIIYSLVRGKELGFKTQSLITWLGQNHIGMITNPDFSPYLSGLYKMPVTRLSDGNWFQSWKELKTGYRLDGITGAKSFFDKPRTDYNVLEQGWSTTFSAAIAMIADEPGGGSAWDWVNQEIFVNNPLFDANPKWAIIPRTINSVPAQPVGTITAPPITPVPTQTSPPPPATQTNTNNQSSQNQTNTQTQNTTQTTYTTPQTNTSSPDGSQLIGSGSLTDSQGHTWTFGSPISSGDKLILRDGVNTGGGNSISLALKNGDIYALNSLNDWYKFSNNQWILSSNPNVQTSSPSLPSTSRTSSLTASSFSTVRFRTKHNDILLMQKILNADLSTRVARTGFGSPGQETTFFGALTRQAIVQFQNKYRSEILIPQGLTSGTGFVGNATKKKLREVGVQLGL